MRFLLLLSLLLSASFQPLFAAERILQEWRFTNSSDTLGWSVADDLPEFGVIDGALTATRGQNDIKLESPLFDISATPFQYVEIELKTDTDGLMNMYFSNTSEPPYHGFRPGQYTQIRVKGDGKYHTYKVFPFWHSLGNITHIRFDPPGKRPQMKAVRIISPDAGETVEALSWDLVDPHTRWHVLADSAKAVATSKGWLITGNRYSRFTSPILDIDSDYNYVVTLRIVSDEPTTAQLMWASDAFHGLQSVPVDIVGDGMAHSYPVDLSGVGEWRGKIKLLAIAPTESEKDTSITLCSVDVADKAKGPAELRIHYCGFEDAFVRTGQNVKLILDVRNIGGKAAESVGAGVSLLNVDEDDLTNIHNMTRSLPSKRINLVEPDEVYRFEWPVEDLEAGEYLATFNAVSLTSSAGSKSVPLTVHPKLDRNTKNLDYVPQPEPANTDKYLVGAYYFPGWHTYERWAVLNDFPERRPILGYYREGDPEVADWHIKWALDYGISFFIYDWYWNNGVRQLEHALHDGFFNSKYQNEMKFCLLWANHNPVGTSSEEDLIEVTKYWIENYFNRPNYLKVEGKNVLVLFSSELILNDLGMDATKQAISKMKKLCEDAGVGGLYLVGCVAPWDKKKLQTLSEQGFDAFSGYNMPDAGSRGQLHAPYVWMVDGYKENWNKIADSVSIPYIPVCEPGWDSRPWHGPKSRIRTGKSPQLWEQMLVNAKEFVDNPLRKQDGEKKLVFLEAWNEFGEGDYIEPHAEYGFDYLEAVRNVFALKSAHPTIIVPQDIGMGPYDIPEPPKLTGWIFSNPDHQNWSVGNMKEFYYEDGVMKAEALNNDPAFYSSHTDFDASEFSVLEIKMKMDKGSYAEVFFWKPRGNATQERSYSFPVKADGQFHTYTIDLKSNPKWMGPIGGIRLDPNSVEGSKVEVEYIRLK